MRRAHRLGAGCGLAVALLCIASPAGAQAGWTLRGVALDSLRASGPLIGARVRVIESEHVVLTDSAGRFRVDSIAAQTIRVALDEPWLDSLGLAIEIEVSESSVNQRSVQLVVPPLARMQRELCGGLLPDGSAIVLGLLHGHDRATAGVPEVRARWWKEDAAQRALPVRMEVADVVGDDGSFVLCGVPLEAQIQLEAASGGRRALRRFVLTERLVRRDLVLGAAGVRVVVKGRVVDREGRPVRGAEVFMLSDFGARSLTAADGRFVVDDVEQSSDLLVVRGVGFMPVEVEVLPVTGLVDVPEVVLHPIPPRLAEVEVRAADGSVRAEFEQRRRGALGRFLSDSVLALLPRKTLDAVAERAGRLAVAAAAGGSSVLRMRRGGSWCGPRFFVDGTDLGRLDSPDERGEQSGFVELAVRIEVYTAAEAPPRFNDNDGCGSIVIWTS